MSTNIKLYTFLYAVFIRGVPVQVNGTKTESFDKYIVAVYMHYYKLALFE